MWKDSIRNIVVIFQPNILRIVGFYVRHSATVISHFLHQLNVVVLTLIWTPWSDSADANLGCAEYRYWNLYHSSIAMQIFSIIFLLSGKKIPVFFFNFSSKHRQEPLEKKWGNFQGTQKYDAKHICS